MADDASERPCILHSLIVLLSFLRLLAALATLPSYLCLWFSMLLATSAAFKDTSSGGHRGFHAALAVPRIVAILVVVPASVLGLAFGVELAVQGMNLGWPTGLGASLGFFLNVHGLWFFARHPRLPESARLRYKPFARAVVDAAFDILALLALLVVGATVFRLPVLVKQLTNSAGGCCRRLIIENAGLVFVDLFCLPVLALLVVGPWRWPHAMASLQERDLNPFARRGKLLLNSIDVVVDVPFIVVGLVMVLNPWRYMFMAQEMYKCSRLSDCRLVALRQLAMLALDIACLVLLLLLVATPWRLVWAVQDAFDKKGHRAILWHSALAPVDFLAIISLLLAAPTHRSWWCRTSQAAGKWRESPAVQLEAMRATMDLAIDVFLCLVPFLCLVLSVYRLPLVITGLKDGKGRAFIWIQFGILLFEIPLMCLGLSLIVFPWRFAWLINDVSEASDVASRRSAVLNHFGFAIGDILTFVALLLLLLTGYRLPVAIVGLRDGKGRAFVFWQLGVMIVEIPLLLLGLSLVLIPWRFAWLLNDVYEAKDITFKRLAVFHHVRYAFADVLAIVALLVLFFTAPHRFFASTFQSKLRTGVRFVGKSSNTTLTYRRPSPRVPEEGSTIDAFHGTRPESAAAIEANGFKPSTNGMLGPGVYVSRDPSKAESYGSVILKLKVTIGKTAVIEYMRHPSQTDWSSKGFDVAWVPAGCGMVQSNREEGCVADVAKIQVMGRYILTRHPHLLCIGEGIQGLVDLVICGVPMLVLVMTVYRLRVFLRQARASPCQRSWELRCLCLQQASLVFVEFLMVLMSVVLMAISPWRLVLFAMSVTSQPYNAVVACGDAFGNLFLAALIDPLCLLTLILLTVTGYRLPALRGSMSGQPYFALDSSLPWLVLWEGFQLLLDIPFLPLGLMSLCSWRACFFCRRASGRDDQSAVASEASGNPPGKPQANDGDAAGEWDVRDVNEGPLPAVPYSLSCGASAKPRPVDEEQQPVEVEQHALEAYPVEPDEESLERTLAVAAPSTSGLESGSKGESQTHIAAAQGPEMVSDFTEQWSRSSPAMLRTDATMNRYRWAAAQSFALVLNDITVVVLFILSLTLLTRIVSLHKRITRMLRAYSNQRQNDSDEARTPPEQAEVDVSDFTEGLKHLRQLDGDADHLSLTFFQLVVIAEFCRSLLAIPVLFLAPVMIFLAPSGGIERYVRRRFALPCAVAPVAQDSEGAVAVGPTEGGGEGSEQAAAGPVEDRELLFPTCFFALPFPGLLRISSHSTDDTLWRLELHAFSTLAMMTLLALHELCTLIYVGLLLPQTLGFTFWSAQCKASKLGRRTRNVCNVLQALCLPFMTLFLAAVAMAPSLLWWQPEQGWVRWQPLTVHTAPARIAPPAWGFWVGQAALIVVILAVVELLARSKKNGYIPLRGFAGIIWELLGLVTGHAVFWKCTDVCSGAYVRCCHRHRRTCCGLGEILLAVGVISFFAWPLCLPILLLQDGATIGQKLQWWLGASILSCSLLFHSIRITTKFWGDSSASSMYPPSDLEQGAASR